MEIKKFRLVALILVMAFASFMPAFARGFGSKTPWAINGGDKNPRVFDLRFEKRKMIKFEGRKGLSQVVITENSTGIPVYSGTVKGGIFGPVIGLNQGNYTMNVTNANSGNRIAAGNYSLSK